MPGMMDVISGTVPTPVTPPPPPQRGIVAPFHAAIGTVPAARLYCAEDAERMTGADLAAWLVGDMELGGQWVCFADLVDLLPDFAFFTGLAPVHPTKLKRHLLAAGFDHVLIDKRSEGLGRVVHYRVPGTVPAANEGTSYGVQADGFLEGMAGDAARLQLEEAA